MEQIDVIMIKILKVTISIPKALFSIDAFVFIGVKVFILNAVPHNMINTSCKLKTAERTLSQYATYGRRTTTKRSQMRHSKEPKNICVLLCAPIKIKPLVSNKRRPRSTTSKKKLFLVSV